MLTVTKSVSGSARPESRMKTSPQEPEEDKAEEWKSVGVRGGRT